MEPFSVCYSKTPLFVVHLDYFSVAVSPALLTLFVKMWCRLAALDSGVAIVSEVESKERKNMVSIFMPTYDDTIYTLRDEQRRT